MPQAASFLLAAALALGTAASALAQTVTSPSAPVSPPSQSTPSQSTPGQPAPIPPAPIQAAPAPALSPEQEAAIRALIGEHLRAHPEIVIEALQAWQSRQITEQEIRQRGALAANRAELENDGVSPVAGNPQGDVTVVEFFDYQCGYCKQALPDLRRLLAEQPNLRVVFKEFPVFGPVSEFAARAALAAARQNLYLPFHTALMKAQGPLSEARILKIAEASGLDVARLKRDMQDPAIAAAIAANLSLGEALGIEGTPTFVIGDEVVAGAVGYDALAAQIAEARSTCTTC